MSIVHGNLKVLRLLRTELLTTQCLGITMSTFIDNTYTMIGNKFCCLWLCNQESKYVCSWLFMPFTHIAESHTNDACCDVIGIIEDICIDYFYWLDKSAKHKGKLLEYLSFVTKSTSLF